MAAGIAINTKRPRSPTGARRDGLVFEHEPTVEEALYIWTQHPSADFADCLHNARAAQLGRTRFVTFDAGAAKLPRGELLAGAA